MRLNKTNHIINIISPLFHGIAYIILPYFKWLSKYMKIIKHEKDLHNYISSLLASLFLTISLSFLISGILYNSSKEASYITLSLGTLIAVMNFIKGIFIPKLISEFRKKNIEQNLISVLRIFYIQTKSGVPVYEIIKYISTKEYGVISEEFKTLSKEIESNKPYKKAFIELSERMLSEQSKRAIYIIASASETGSELAKVLEDHIKRLTKEQQEQIRHYSSELNPLTVAYMLIVVIIPSLAITLIISVSAFSSNFSDIMNIIFFFLGLAIILFQYSFIGIIKSRRPALLRM